MIEEYLFDIFFIHINYIFCIYKFLFKRITITINYEAIYMAKLFKKIKDNYLYK